MRIVKKITGFGVIEILIASGIIGATLFSLYYVFALGTRLSSDAGSKVSGNFLAEEGLEAARFLRDSDDNIVSSGGTVDPDTKKINIEIAWQGRGATSTILLSTYLADLFEN